jgi:hypothetical protein
MKLYADLPARRVTQVTADALLVVWVLFWTWLGHAVHDATLDLATPGYRVESAGTGMAERLDAAGSAVGGLPVVGDQAAAPLQQAGDAAAGLASAGRTRVEAVGTLANWLGWAIALVRVLVLLVVYVPRRVAFVREASAGQALVDSAADLDLFALRALAHQPLHRLARISDDPVRAWRERDAVLVTRLATLELAEVGLHPPTDASAG